jgi:hypothetical protein
MKVGRWAAGLVAVVVSVVSGVTVGCGSPQTVPASSSAAPSPVPTAASPTSMSVHLTGHGFSDTSSNWAGYCAIGRHFTSVSATWVQPQLDVSGTRQRCVAIWVGLDGYKGSTVEQTGTEGDSQGGSDPYVDCDAWWYMYPSTGDDIASARVAVGSQQMRVGAGETVTATVTRLPGGRFRLTLMNVTEGERFSTIKTDPNAPADTAEIIVEMPGAPAGWRLAYFRPVRFTHCSIDGRPIGDWHWVRLDMTTGPTFMAGPSSLGPDGATFTVWRR